MQRQAAGVEEAEGAQILQQALHHPHLVQQQTQVLGIDLVDPVEHRLDLAPDHRQRCPHLVAQVGQQPAPLLVGRLEGPAIVLNELSAARIELDPVGSTLAV